MHSVNRLTASLLAALVLAACTESRQPTAPLANIAAHDGASSVLGAVNVGASVRKVLMHDMCDPTTFNAAVGPGTCLRPGGMKFDQFIAQLSKHQEVQGYDFFPQAFRASSGQLIIAINTGGEVHTFTRVAAFGGGIVPLLNGLSGNPAPAPECLQLGPADFVGPGGSVTAVANGTGPLNYQCCIHPWMRTTVN